MELIKDLGMKYPTEKSKRKYRYGVYKCYVCGYESESQINTVSKCKKCFYKNKKSVLTNGVCSVDNCSNQIHAKKLCNTHYAQIKRNGSAQTIREQHGGKHTRLYTTWRNMKDRCLNKNSTFYHRYGGRGITVYNDWIDSFVKFKEWSEAHNYNDSLEIDRIDNESGYCPDNCRFVSRTENMNNRKISISNRFTIDELSDICEMPDRGFLITEVAEATGLSRASIQRLRRGIYNG